MIIMIRITQGIKHAVTGKLINDEVTQHKKHTLSEDFLILSHNNKVFYSFYTTAIEHKEQTLFT